MKGYRLNRSTSSSKEGAIVPVNPKGADAALVRKMAKEYKDFHWGLPATRVFRVNDAMIPHVTAYGPLEEIHLQDGEHVAFPGGGWVCWDPKHKRKRLYIVPSKEAREMIRNFMKHVPPGKMEPLQKIALRAGGKQASYKLPDIKGVEIGTMSDIVYFARKNGEPDEVKGTSYIHEFGGDDMGGHRPKIAFDASGRIWVCGGDYACRAAGITG